MAPPTLKARLQERKNNPRLGSKCLLMKQAVGSVRTSHLQVASGGQFKHQLVSKIVHHLKSDYLEGKEKKLTVNQLLLAVSEPIVSNELSQWLRDDALPNNSRIRVLSNNKFGYKPPLAVSSAGALVKLLKRIDETDKGGLLQTLVDESLPNSDREIAKLIAENRIYKITRADKENVLFLKSADPHLDWLSMEESFAQYWRQIDVSNKEKDQINKYLENKKICFFDEAAFEKDFQQNEGDERESNEPSTSKTPPPAKKPRKRATKIRDNVHVENDLQTFDPSIS